MGYDFDRIIERRNTGAIKYNFAERRRPDSALSLWVADMDFAAPDCVAEALAERVAHGIYGYSEPDERYWEALRGWMKSRFDWEPPRDWLVPTPGVVYALATAVRAFTEPGDAVLIQQPVYYPFAEVVEDNGRTLAVSELLYDRESGSYAIDWDGFAKTLESSGAKLFILCSPHNPVGRVWREEELRRLGELCLAHGVKVISDEIHMDFVRPGHRHRVFSSLNEALADISVVCTAPSKTFNLAGLQCSNIFIKNRDMRNAFRREITASGYSQLGTMGLISCRAAYEGGADWLEALKDYLEGNLALIRDRLRELPELRLIEPEGTYLVWIDCGGLRLRGRELDCFMLDEAGLWLDVGSMFGAGGDQFVRINITSPRAVIAEAMDRLEQAVAKRRG